jgi:hypothetical protein
MLPWHLAHALPEIGRLVGAHMDKPPKKLPGDRVFEIVQATASVVPVAGTAVSAVMGLIGPKIAQRRDQWFELLADKISELETKVEGFTENPMFITAVFEATSSALKTHERQKLEALRNAVGNSPLPGAPDDSTQLLFLRFVDELSALHLKVLAVLNDPNSFIAKAGPINESGSGLELLMRHCIPETRQSAEGVLEQIHRDLENRGLVMQENFKGALVREHATQKRTTALGKNFLRFIS